MNQKTLWAQAALGLTQREPEQARDQRGRFAVEPESYDPHHRGFTPAAAVPFDAGARPGPVRPVDPVADHAALLLGLIGRRHGSRGEPNVWHAAPRP
jgi:hypothetical protein